MLDGNRRWAKAVGARHRPRPPGRRGQHRAAARAGARRSASRSSRCGCSPPTTSTVRRAELEPLLGIIEDAVASLADAAALADAPRRRARPAARRRSPSGSRRPRRRPATSTGMLVNVAVGYGGRREIADAVRSLLQEHAGRAPRSRSSPSVIDVEHIAEHLYTKGQPDPDLVIRTSRRAAARRLPALAERAVASSTSARPTGPTSAASTSCARSGRTPSASAASAPDRRASTSPASPSPAFGRVAPDRPAPRRTFRVSASGEARRTGRPVRETHDRQRTAASLARDGGRHSGPRARSRSTSVS